MNQLPSRSPGWGRGASAQSSVCRWSPGTRLRSATLTVTFPSTLLTAPPPATGLLILGFCAAHSGSTHHSSHSTDGPDGSFPGTGFTPTLGASLHREATLQSARTLLGRGAGPVIPALGDKDHLSSLLRCLWSVCGGRVSPGLWGLRARSWASVRGVYPGRVTPGAALHGALSGGADQGSGLAWESSLSHKSTGLLICKLGRTRRPCLSGSLSGGNEMNPWNEPSHGAGVRQEGFGSLALDLSFVSPRALRTHSSGARDRASVNISSAQGDCRLWRHLSVLWFLFYKHA